MFALIFAYISFIGVSPAHADPSPFLWRIRCEHQPVGYDLYATMLMGDLDFAIGKDGTVQGWLRDGDRWVKLTVSAQVDKLDLNYKTFGYVGSQKFEHKGNEKHRKYSGQMRVYMSRPAEDARVEEMMGAEKICGPGIFADCSEWTETRSPKPFRAYCVQLK